MELRMRQCDVARERLTRLAALLRAGATPAQAFATLAERDGAGAGTEAAGGTGRHGTVSADRAFAGANRAPRAGGGRRALGGRRAVATRLDEDLGSAWRAVCRSVSLALAAGAELPRADPSRAPGRPHGVGSSWRQLRWVCSMASATGAPLASLLERLAGDAAATADALRARQAGAAAAATTRKVLAWLPVGGLVLAQALGARPLDVLATTVPGRVTALLGVGFWVAALVWSRRVVASPAPASRGRRGSVAVGGGAR
jgi:hypothetical protein